MKIGSIFSSKNLALGMILLSLNQLKSTPENIQSDEITIHEASKVLEFAHIELDTPQNFMTGVISIGLIMKIEEVAQALKNNNKVSSEIRKLKFPTKIANLLKKAYRESRKQGSPGFGFKEHVGTLLGFAYEKWAEDDPLRENFKNWAKQISDELDKEKAPQISQDPKSNDVNVKLSQNVKHEDLVEDSDSITRDSQVIFNREKQVRKQKPRVTTTSTTQETSIAQEQKPKLKKQRINTFQIQPSSITKPSSENQSRQEYSKGQKAPLAWEQKSSKNQNKYQPLNSATNPKIRQKQSVQTSDSTHQLERRKPKNTKDSFDRKKREDKASPVLSRKSESSLQDRNNTTTFRSH